MAGNFATMSVAAPGAIFSGSAVSGSLGDGFVFSGHIASGQIGSPHFAYGSFVPRIVYWFTAGETISGVKVVAFGSGAGDVAVRAERQSGLRLPAFGVSISGNVSGSPFQAVLLGAVTTAASGMLASGFHGRILYLGSGGLLVNQSGFMGGASSGDPFLSGSAVQSVGFAISGGIFVQVGELRSGLLTVAGQGVM